MLNKDDWEIHVLAFYARALEIDSEDNLSVIAAVFSLLIEEHGVDLEKAIIAFKDMHPAVRAMKQLFDSNVERMLEMKNVEAKDQN